MEDLLKSRAIKKLLDFDLPNLIEAINKLNNSITTLNKIEEKKSLLERKRILTEGDKK